MKNFSPNTPGNRQQGAALLVSLIIMLAMTITGITVMNGARQEINMAALMQQEEVALRRAERTLLAAEADVEGQGSFNSAVVGHFLPGNNLDAQTASWSAIASKAGPVSSDNDIDDDDAYVIEYLGTKDLPGESVGVNPDTPVIGGSAHVYRITARSASGGKSIRLVETTYTKIN